MPERAAEARQAPDDIREELIAYNRDDLEALVATLRAIEELPMTPEGEEASNAARPLQGSFEYS